MTRRASLPGADELFRKTDQDTKHSPQQQEAAQPAPAPAQAVPPLAAPPVAQPEKPVQIPVQAPPGVTPDFPPVAPLSTSPQVGSQVQVGPSRSQGRPPRHDEKVTFYCTADELTRLERARLDLRADHRMASDRGRIIRTALAVVLDEFERQGAESQLVKRLGEF